MNSLTFNLYGDLGERYGKTYTLQCNSVREGIAILCANFKGMRKYFIDSSNWLQGYEVWAGDRSLKGTNEDLNACVSGTVKIIPVIKGASANARIIVGVILVAAGWLTQNSSVVMMGVSMIVGGIAEKLSPKVKVNTSDTSETDSATSYIFSGAVNNVVQGVPVAIGYGRMYVGSSVISSSISTADVAV